VSNVIRNADPRTEITKTLAKYKDSGYSIGRVTVAIGENVALWLTMEAGSFEPFDERTPGYLELAQRLRGL
jgi:hypothetical protein